MKIPKPRKRGEAYYIEIMINGKRSSATRDTIKECTQSAYKRLMELQLKYEKELKDLDKPKCSLSELFNLYYEKVGQFTKSKNYIKNHIKWLDRYYRDGSVNLNNSYK